MEFDESKIEIHIERTYIRLHIPTSKSFEGTATFISERAFLVCLDNWNRVGKDWKYWGA